MVFLKIALLGDVRDIIQTLDIFNSVQQQLAVSRLVIITTDPLAVRPRVKLFPALTDVIFLDLQTFEFESILPVDVLINLSPTAGLPLFKAAMNAITIVSARPTYMPSVFVPNESVYEFEYQDLRSIEATLIHIAAHPEEANKFAQEARHRTLAWCGPGYLAAAETEGVTTHTYRSWLVSIAKKVLFSGIPSRYLIQKGRSARPEFSLTFDDGPDPATTPAILEALRLHGVQATFFLVGNRAEQYPNLVRAICQAGHEVGSHSHTHPHFHRLSFRQATVEIAASRRVLEGITGQACRFFRPPFGKVSVQSLLPAWHNKQGVVLWTVDLRDYKAKERSEIESRVAVQSFISGDIILYHGLTLASLQALSSVIVAAKGMGREGVSVSRLIQ